MDRLRLAASRGYEQSGVGGEVAFGEGVIGVVASRRRMLRVGNIGVSMAYLRSVRAQLEAAGQVAAGGETTVLPGLPGAYRRAYFHALTSPLAINAFAL